jgi:hypothetical protein
MSAEWTGFNNVGVGSTAIGTTLNHSGSLSLAKAMIIMPLVMHEATLRFLANGRVRERQVAAFTSARPDLVANFSKRYADSLVASLNAVQLLIGLGYAEYDDELTLHTPFEITPEFGKRASLIEKASKNISALLTSSDEELYLNFRVKL